MKEILDWRKMDIIIERKTRHNYISASTIDYYYFIQSGHNIYKAVIQRKSRVARFNLTVGETLAKALEKFAEFNGCDIINKPKKVDKIGTFKD